MEEIYSRIKLIFHGGILSDSQISEGLKNTWVILKPQHQRTISDLGSYILQLFHLHESCPGGVLLYMDGFVLPPFESTSILKDKDVISVKRRLGTPAIECNEVSKKRKRKLGTLAIECNEEPLKSGPLLLANEEFNKEAGGYENEGPVENGKDQVQDTSHLKDKSSGDATSKKTKASEKIHSSKKKKHNSELKEPDIDAQAEHTENPELVLTKKKSTHKKQKISGSNKKDDAETNGGNALAEHTENMELVLTKKKSTHKKQKIYGSNEKDDAETNEGNALAEHTENLELVLTKKKSTHKKQKISDSNVKDDAETIEDNVTTPVKNMNDNFQEAEKNNVDTKPKSEETPKRPSRTARRKSAKRKWYREMDKIKKANADSQSDAHRNWEEMQLKSVGKESAGQSNGHKSSADIRSEALRNWKEMQSKSGREDAADQPNGHKTNADSPSEALRNWKEMQSKVGMEGTSGQPNIHRNFKVMHSKSGEAFHQPNRNLNTKWGQSSVRSEEGVSQPNGYLNTKWGQSSVRSEEGLNQPNGYQNWKQGQTGVKSREGASPQKGNWTNGQTMVKNAEGVSLVNGQTTSERREASDQLRGLLHSNEFHGNDMVKDAVEHIQPDARNNSCDKPNQNDDSNDETEVVPVEIRPGHIRFEPLGKERTVEQYQLNPGNFQWNGITSKKKGQKWGTEKSSYSQRNEHDRSNREQSEMLNAENLKHSNESFDFTKVPFLTGSPKKGDVVAYRLIELSSTWTPELSSYRVGKVSAYDSQSRGVSLVPVPEFPIFCKKSDEDESSMQPNDSLYKEDGSLEIDFSSLVEARILEQKTGVPGSSSEGVAGDDSTMLTVTADMQQPASIPENSVDPWEQFSEALNAKKQQLSQESNIDSGSSGKRLSHKALRGSALGPTMALLRSKNQL